MVEPTQYSFSAFYTPDLSLLSDDSIDELYTLYDNFVTAYSSHFCNELPFEYFLAFAIFSDPANDIHQRHIPKELIFKYKKFPTYAIDDNLIIRMYEQLVACSYQQFFTTMTSDTFLRFIAPFMQEFDYYSPDDDEPEQQSTSGEYTITIVPNAYEIQNRNDLAF